MSSSRPKLAAVVTTHRKYSHAQHIVDRFLYGYGWHGVHHYPEMDLVSLYVDQVGEGDLSKSRGEQFPAPDGKLTFDKFSPAFLSGNTTRDDQPNPTRIERKVPRDIADMWVHMCPAQVYEIGTEGGDQTVTVNVAPSNCVQCGAVTAKGGRFTPPAS